MQENSHPAPTHAPQPAPHKDYAVTSMVLGLVGLFFIVIGIIPAIIAIILGTISLRNKTPRKPQAIVGVVAGGLAILTTFGAIALVSLLIAHNPFENLLSSGGSDRRALVEARIAAKKDFAVGETARMGVFDLKVTDVVRNYVPTAEETKSYDADSFPREDAPNKKYAALAESEVEYIAVSGTVVGNSNPPLGDDDADMRHIELNYVDAFQQDGGYAKGAKTGSSTPTEFRFIYRIRSGSDKLVLRNNVTIWKSISNIVGTEGMPRVGLSYSLRLN